MKWNHHIPLICELKPIFGYFLPDVTLNELLSKRRSKYLTKMQNKGYRNIAYYFNTFITNSGQTLITTGGSSIDFRPVRTDTSSTSYVSPHESMYRFFINIGSSTSPHDVTRYQLYSPHFGRGAGGWCWLVEEPSQTRVMTYHRYAFPAPSRAVGEAGLYTRLLAYGIDLSYTYERLILLARAIIDPPITKTANELHEEGWEITFPANYTVYWIRAIFNCGGIGDTGVGEIIRDASGATYVARHYVTFAGSPDVMIGSNNTPPSPTDHHLKAPIASLASQSHAVEIDTVNQECRIVRVGTYTPSTTVTLGEVALYSNLTDTGGASRKVMVARGIWDPPVTLEAGFTYTIGIALRLG